MLSEGGFPKMGKHLKASNSKLKLEETDKLNRKIAVESLTLFKGTTEFIQNFKATNFSGVSISKNTENQFFQTIHQNIKFIQSSSTDTAINGGNNVLLAVFPPQVKPTHNFGFSNEELIFINELVQTRNVVMYLFGNPYVLNHINVKKMKAVVIVHQDFTAFQEVAAEHFLGKFTARGKLAVRVYLNEQHEDS